MPYKKKRHLLSWATSRISPSKIFSTKPDSTNTKEAVTRLQQKRPGIVSDLADDDEESSNESCLTYSSTRDHHDRRSSSTLAAEDQKQQRQLRQMSNVSNSWKNSENEKGWTSRSESDRTRARSLSGARQPSGSSKYRFKDTTTSQARKANKVPKSVPNNIFSARAVTETLSDTELCAKSTSTASETNEAHQTPSMSSANTATKVSRNVQQFEPKTSDIRLPTSHHRKDKRLMKQRSLQPAETVTISTPISTHTLDSPVSSLAKPRNLNSRQTAVFERIAHVYGRGFAERHLNADSIRTFSSTLSEEICSTEESDQCDTELESPKAGVENVERGWDAVLAEARRQAEKLERRAREQAISLTSADSHKHIRGKKSSSENDSLLETGKEKGNQKTRSKGSHKGETILTNKPKINNGKLRKRKRNRSSLESETKNDEYPGASKTPKKEESEVNVSLDGDSMAVTSIGSASRKRRLTGEESTDSSGVRSKAVATDRTKVKTDRNKKLKSSNLERGLSDTDKDVRRLENFRTLNDKHKRTARRSEPSRIDGNEQNRSESSIASLTPFYDLADVLSAKCNDADSSNTSVADPASLSSIRSLIPERLLTMASQQLNLTEYQRVSAIISEEREAEQKRLKKHKGPVKPRTIWQDIDVNLAIENGLVEGARVYENDDSEVVIEAATQLIRALSGQIVGEAARNSAGQSIENGKCESGRKVTSATEM